MRITFVLLILLTLSLGLYRGIVATDELLTYNETFDAEPAQKQAITGLLELARHDVPMPANTPAAHASFLLTNNEHPEALRVFWFAGSRESGEDVQIFTSTFTAGSLAQALGAGVWSPPALVVNRHAAAEALGFGSWIRRLGNPVAWIDRQGRSHLYVVATGVGGWAASRILHLRQDAPGTAFLPIGFLQLSPLFNISTLVRGAPVVREDGNGALLPAYFELGVKYPVALRLNGDGELMGGAGSVVRMGGGLASLQPSVVAHSATHALAYLRDNAVTQQIKIVETKDAGNTWQDKQGLPSATVPLVNPDASVAAVRLPDGSTALVRNPDATGRQRLVVERSVDGVSDWQLMATLEDERGNASKPAPVVPFNEYSYPSAVVIGDELHISYTYQRRFIRHVVLVFDVAQGAHL